MRRHETVLCYLHNTSGIEVFFKTPGVASMEILGSWYYTRGSRAASILSGEPSVPGEIPGGVERGSIPGRLAVSTQGGVPSVPGKIPGGMTSCPTPVGQQARVVSLISLSIPGQIDVLFIPGQIDVLFIPGGGGESLFTPAALWQWAFRRPIHARWAITTALAWPTSWGPLSGRWHLLWQVGLVDLQYCRQLGPAI